MDLNVTIFTTSLMTDITPDPSTQFQSMLTNGRLQIPFYVIILLLAIIGNILVIMTLVQNRRMRTITNAFLINLAISDILLGVLCMPFTLVGTLLRDFIFGEIMCKILPYLQASSVAVSAWTLVAISCERYYAICHPLRSRRWQTISHAYKLIAVIWLSSLFCMLPIAILSKLIPTSNGHHKCREDWSNNKEYEKIYNLFLDFILLLVPLGSLSVAYSLITRTLSNGIRSERITKNNSATAATQQLLTNNYEMCTNSHGKNTTNKCLISSGKNSHYQHHQSCRHQQTQQLVSYPLQNIGSATENHIIGSKKLSIGLRRTNTEKSLQNKRRVIKMLFVVVLEFFICWTPLYVINTIALFNPMLIYQHLGYTSISFFQLLAYSSSCCNPITYCFMNRGFRKACFNLFRCCKKINRSRHLSVGGERGYNGTGRNGGFIYVGNGVTQSSEMT